MDPIRHLHSPVAGIFCWKGYSEDVRTDLSATAIVTDEGLIFIDPIPLAEEAMEQLTAAGKPLKILLTNGNHQRDSLKLRDALKIPILAPAECRRDIEADDFFEQDKLPVPGVQTIRLPGFAPGETAYLFGTRALVLGDAMINLPSEGFRMLPEQYCEDAHLAIKSLSRLARIEAFDVLCFAHGMPIEEDARHKLLEAFQETGVVPE